MLRKPFYQDCYLQTGWIPMQPLTHTIEIGDVYQINNGAFQPLMNLVNINLVENVAVSKPIELNPLDWRINRGVKQVYCGTQLYSDQLGEQESRVKQVIEFSQAKNFIFAGSAAKCHLVLNWNEIKDDAILKLTQTHYGFRELYFVTGVAVMENWGLAISGGERGLLEVSAGLDTSDYVTLMNHSSSRREECNNIACYEKSQGEPAYFFKAKKLMISDSAYDKYLNRLVENQQGLTQAVMANWLSQSLINLTQSNELNLASTMGAFSWTNAGLDDIERLEG